MNVKEKIHFIIVKLISRTSEKRCNWKLDRILLNDNNHTSFFDGYRTNFKSGWITIFKNSEDTFIISFGKGNTIIWSECCNKKDNVCKTPDMFLYPLLKLLYKEVIVLNSPESGVLDSIVKEIMEL
jgi:hypothetical protein